MANETKVAVVTGAYRGIGLEVCRQLAEQGYRVVLTARDMAKGRDAAQSLVERGLSVGFQHLDVTDPKSIRRMQQAIEVQYGRVDVLVNNAAILLDGSGTVVETPPDDFQATFETNVRGPFLLCQALVPGMVRRGYGRVVNVSSGAGQLATMRTYAPAYSISKAALNALTLQVAGATRGGNVLVNCVDPGWVRTEMGGQNAPRSVAQGAETIVWLATLPDTGPTGGFFHDRKPIDW